MTSAVKVCGLNGFAMQIRTRRSCVVSALLAATFLSAPVAAQTVPDRQPEPSTAQPSAQDNGLADIVVTAQRRSENLQNVPITVSALSGDAVKARGIQDVQDLNIASPGLSVTRLIGPPVIYLRGVGNNNATAGQEQNVAIYVDGVYYPSIAADLGSFQNIERIEILKGPQGTLFGRNTTGGLIQIITKDPSHTLGGNITAGYGNYRTVDGSFYLTGGLSSTLAADLAVNYRNQDQGWGRNLTTGKDINKGRSFDIRSKWLWEPASGTKFTLIGAYNYSNADFGDQQQVISANPIPPNGDKFSGNIYDSTLDEPGVGTRVRQYSASLKFEQDLGFATLTSLSSYQYSDALNHLDLDKTSTPGLTTDFPIKTKSFGQELNLSNKSGPLTWIIGGMYYWANGFEDPLAIYAGPTHLLAVAYDAGQKTTSFAGYGQATYAISSNTNVTLGGRYTSDHNELYGSTTALTDSGYVTLFANDATRRKTFRKFTWKAAIDHHFTPDIMAYASVSTGFKSGVYNITFSDPSDGPVKPETLTSYETGIKTEFFDHKVRFNLTGFYYDYKNLQLQTYVTTRILLINAASAKVYGGEAELQAQLAPGLSLNAGGTLLHSEYRNFLNAPHYDSSSGVGVLVPIDASGNRLMRAPTFTANFSLDYQQPVSFGTLGANATFYRNSGFFFEPDNVLRQPAYNLVNTELSWTSLDKKFRLRVWARNLFDKKYYALLLSGAGSPDVEAPAAPRTYGATLSVNF